MHPASSELMISSEEKTGDEAYHLYCRSRCGDSKSFNDLEKKYIENSHDNCNVKIRLIWEGYYINALFYNELSTSDEVRARDLCQSFYTALCTVVQDESCAHLQYLLGWLYHNGLGVARDNTQAVKFFRLASDKGLAIAYSNLGICYDDGEGVPKDQVEGARLFRLGANKEHPPAQYNLGLSFYYGKGVSENVVEAFKLFRKSAEHGFAPGQYMIGECYERGLGVERDIDEAIRYYELAASQGYAEAYVSLGLCYEYEAGFIDLDEAARLMHMAADRGLPYAQYTLGIYYNTGIGVLPSQKESVKFFHMAADQDFTEAIFSLGNCYENGFGVEKDIIKAVKWYKRAVKMGYSAATEKIIAISDDYKEAVWNQRRNFLLFLVRCQFIYRHPLLKDPMIDSNKITNDISECRISSLGPDPNVVHTVFYTEDMRRVIMSYL